MICIFVTLGKKDDECLSQTQQVTCMLEGIKCDDGELKGAKAVIYHNFSDDFAGAASFFGSSVANIHSEAQLEYHCDRARKCGISLIHHDTMHQGGQGHGHFGRRFGQSKPAAETTMAEEAVVEALEPHLSMESMYPILIAHFQTPNGTIVARKDRAMC